MLSPDEYAQIITQQAAARACAALGFKTAQTEVLECLSDVVSHYIQKLSRESLHLAELHGRAQPGLQDLLQALEGLRPLKSSWVDLREFAFPELSQGQTDSQISNITSASSSRKKEEGNENEDEDEVIDRSDSRYVHAIRKGWRQPFPHMVPQFPVRHRTRVEDAGAIIGEKVVRGAHVPEHLPAYPPQHTYKRSNTDGNGSRKRAAAAAAKEKESQRVKREAASSISKSLAKIEDCADEVIVEGWRAENH